MARDVELLEHAERGVAGCRLYSWTGPWITLGKFQSPSRDLMPGCSVPWIVRPTGGKAVLHGHDMTVGFAVALAPLGLEERSIKAAYRWMAMPLIAGMRACGLPAALGEDTRFTGRGPRVADCFAHVSPNDIVDERTGQKVCGCALKVTPSAALLQASITVGTPLIDPATVLVGGKALATPPWDFEAFGEALAVRLSDAAS